MERTQNHQSHQSNNTVFEVVHPLDDVLEKKISLDGAGPMRMTRTVKVSLICLRVYLVLMMLLLVYAVLQQSGVFR